MSEIFDRRQFTLSTAAGLGGLFLPGWGPSTAVHAEVPAISQHRLIELGANALARSAEMNYFADGHRGASMISAHLMCVDNNFDDAASSRIVELFDKNWANAKLCADFPEQDPMPIEEAGAAPVLGQGLGLAAAGGRRQRRRRRKRASSSVEHALCRWCSGLRLQRKQRQRPKLRPRAVLG